MKADFQRVYWNYPSREPENFLKHLWVILNSQGFQALTIYRLQRWCLSRDTRPGIFFIKRFLSVPSALIKKIIVSLYDINISRYADIEQGLCIHHFGGIYIGPCKIGKNCTISQQVTIATNAQKGRDYAIILEDQVWVGGHCSIDGKIHIGKGSTIASGAKIKNSISANSLVAGQKGRTLKNNFNNLKLHNFPDYWNKR